MKKEYLYKYLDSSKDNPNNEQIKIDRINGFKKCLVCQETKDLSKFVYRRGKFDLNCLKCNFKCELLRCRKSLMRFNLTSAFFARFSLM